MKQQLSVENLFTLYKSERLPSLATIKNYQSLLRVYTRDVGIKANIKVTHQQLIQWRDNILSRATITTFNTYLRQMKAIYEVAVEFAYLDKNPFKQIKTILNYHTRQKTIDQSLFKDVIAICGSGEIENGWFWGIVVNTYYYTGIRLSQLVGIKWCDINFNKQTLKINATNSKTKREILLTLNNKQVKDLIYLKDKALTIKPNISSDDQVFNLTLFSQREFTQKTMTVNHVTSFFRRMTKKTNKPISAHRLRHTMATNIANHPSSNIRVLQQMLGHVNISTTMGYIHPNLDNMREMQALL